MSVHRTRLRDYFWQEFLCSIVLGAIPCVLMSTWYGVPALLEYLRGLVPPDRIVMYFGALMLFHLGAWGSNYFWVKPNDSLDVSLNNLNAVTVQLGFSLLGIYRAVVGATLIVVLCILVADPSRASFKLFLLTYPFAIGCIVLCCGLSFVQDRTAARKINML